MARMDVMKQRGVDIDLIVMESVSCRWLTSWVIDEETINSVMDCLKRKQYNLTRARVVGI